MAAPIHVTLNPVIVSALSALGGSLVGALASIYSTYILQTGATRRQLLDWSIESRQKLYSCFIRKAAQLYGDAMTQSTGDVSRVVELYSIVNRIRLISSHGVVECAEQTVKRIMERYTGANVKVEDFPTAALASHFDPLEPFSTACRRELNAIGSGRND